jgi:hypothetical protein
MALSQYDKDFLKKWKDTEKKGRSLKRGGRAGEQIPSGYRVFNIEKMTPQQRQLLDQRMKELGPDSYLSRLASGDESFYDEMEAPAMQQNRDLQSGLSSRFSGSTGPSGYGKSALERNLSQDLRSQRLGMRSQALQSLQGMSSQLMQQRPYERGLVEKNQKPQSFGRAILPGAIGAIGTAVGAYAGGPSGAQAGGKVGTSLGSAIASR